MKNERSIAAVSPRRRSKETVVELMPPTLRPKRPTYAEQIEARIVGTLGDVRAQFMGLLEAYDRRMRRWRTKFWLVAVVIVVGVLSAVIAYAVYHNSGLRRELAHEKFGRTLAEARLACGERLDNRVAATQADVLSGHRKSVWMAKCIQEEIVNRLNRAGDGATGAAASAGET